MGPEGLNNLHQLIGPNIGDWIQPMGLEVGRKPSGHEIYKCLCAKYVRPRRVFTSGSHHLGLRTQLIRIVPDYDIMKTEQSAMLQKKSIERVETYSGPTQL